MTDQYQPNNINSPRGARSISADAAMTLDDDVVVISAGAPTLTLPSASQIPGQSVSVKSTTGTGTLVGQGGETIDGSASFAFATANQALILKSNGTGWIIASDTGSAAAVSVYEKRTYGSFVGVFNSDTAAPLDITKLTNTATKRGNMDLVNSFGSYADCQWDAIVSSDATTQTIYEGMTFASLNDIVAWVNANVTTFAGNFNQTATFFAYDLVDDSITPLNKIYGKNAIMSRMRPGGRYWSPTSKTPVTSRWTDQPDFLRDLWTATWNGTPMGPNPFNDPEMACFWYSQNHRRMYQIGGPGMQVQVDAANGRNMLRIGDGARVPATLTSWDPASVANGEPTYGIVNSSGTSWQFANLFESFKDIPAALSNGKSVVYAQPLEDAGGGAGNRSIFLKPVGIDQIFTNYFDPAQFRLEAVASWMNDGYRKMRTMTPLSPPSSLANSTGPYLSLTWMDIATANGQANISGHTLRPGLVNFQLRDLTTNRVSILAQGSIDWIYRRRRLPLAAIVQNDAR